MYNKRTAVNKALSEATDSQYYSSIYSSQQQ